MSGALPSIAAGLLAGLLSAPHCLAMCGPLATAASCGRAGTSGARALRYQLGRALAYAGVGALLGAAGETVLNGLVPEWAGHVLAAVVAAVMVGTAASLLRPASPRLVTIGRSEGLTARLSRAAGGARDRVLGALLRTLREPSLMGAVAVLLPCGALYGGFAIAAASGSAIGGGLAMASFAIASGPGLALASWAGMRGLASVRGRWLVAMTLILGAGLVILRPMALAGSERAACHGAP